MTFRSLRIAAAILAGMLGMANVAQAEVVKILVPNFAPNLSVAGQACEDLRGELLSAGGTVKGGDVVSQISTDSLVDQADYPSTNPFQGNKGSQSFKVTAIANNGKQFDWEEHPTPGGGFDIVLVQAKEKIAYAHSPSVVQGASYGDINSPFGSVTFVMFCSFAGADALLVNPEETCKLSSSEYNKLYQSTAEGGLGWLSILLSRDLPTGEMSLCLPPGLTAQACCTACTSTPDAPGHEDFPLCKLATASDLGNNECDQADAGDLNDRPFCAQTSAGDAFLTPEDVPASFNLQVFEGESEPPIAPNSITTQATAACTSPSVAITYEWPSGNLNTTCWTP